MEDKKKTKMQLLMELVTLRKQNAEIRGLNDELKSSDVIWREREERLKMIITSMDDLVFSLDENGTFVDYHQPPNRTELYARPEDFLGKSFKKVLPPDIAKQIEEAFDLVKTTREARHIDYSINIEGRQSWYNAKLSVLEDRAGNFTGVTAVARDITERKLTEKALENAAHIDPLTGLSNRRDFTEKLEKEISRFKRNSHHFSFIMSDIDFFKSINDKYSHECGDYVLRRIAKILKSSLREQDTVGRWGGEEFTILLPETDHNGSKIVAEKVRKRISSMTFSFNEDSFNITMSFGVNVYSHEMSMKELIKGADERLYMAKDMGRNRVVS